MIECQLPAEVCGFLRVLCYDIHITVSLFKYRLKHIHPETTISVLGKTAGRYWFRHDNKNDMETGHVLIYLLYTYK